METGESVSAKITKLRKLRGISQEELADLTGVSRQTIYKWEAGLTEPKHTNLKNLCAAFNVDENYFTDNDINDKTINNEIECEMAVTHVPSLTECKPDKTKRKFPLFLGLIISSITLFALGFIFTWFGFAVFTTNKGNVSTSSFQHISFSILALVSLLLVINASFEASLIIRLIKSNRK